MSGVVRTCDRSCWRLGLRASASVRSTAATKRRQRAQGGTYDLCDIPAGCRISDGRQTAPRFCFRKPDRPQPGKSSGECASLYDRDRTAVERSVRVHEDEFTDTLSIDDQRTAMQRTMVSAALCRLRDYAA